MRPELDHFARNTRRAHRARRYGIGANDVGNAFGTSVGSGAIGLRWALAIGGLMDWLGASTLGAGALVAWPAGRSLSLAV